MIVDVTAPVLYNRRLAAHYNVIALEVPEIAGATSPGQFVMVKAAPGLEPLLRRPFSIFEVLRDAEGTPTGITLLNKRVGMSTGQLFDACEGQRLACLGPLGRAFALPEPATEAWMVAGGVGLAPFATLADSLRARGVPMTLFYGGRSASDLFCIELFEEAGAQVMLATEDGTRGERGRVTRRCSARWTIAAHAASRCLRAAPNRCSQPWRTSPPAPACPARSPWNG